ncbi:MAG TPA: hypothetical protein VKC56_08800 [Gallionellaceae bacterium]|nr:hypothetical protein [Gallionellaceae bacterium]
MFHGVHVNVFDVLEDTALRGKMVENRLRFAAIELNLNHFVGEVFSGGGMGMNFWIKVACHPSPLPVEEAGRGGMGAATSNV